MWYESFSLEALGPGDAWFQASILHAVYKYVGGKGARIILVFSLSENIHWHCQPFVFNCNSPRFKKSLTPLLSTNVLSPRQIHRPIIHTNHCSITPLHLFSNTNILDPCPRLT